mgnify:CR=1 FL=1
MTGHLFPSDMLFNLGLNFHYLKVNLILKFKAMYIPLMNYSKYATPPIPTVNIGAGNENWNISFENKQYRPNLRQTVGTIY